MTLKELLLKYEFDTVVPDLLTVDEPIKDNLYAFKEAFDTLRRMAPGDAQGEQIVVSLGVETAEDGTEIESGAHFFDRARRQQKFGRMRHDKTIVG